jgi:hypothetical protein
MPTTPWTVERSRRLLVLPGAPISKESTREGEGSANRWISLRRSSLEKLIKPSPPIFPDHLESSVWFRVSLRFARVYYRSILCPIADSRLRPVCAAIDYGHRGHSGDHLLAAMPLEDSSHNANSNTLTHTSTTAREPQGIISSDRRRAAAAVMPSLTSQNCLTWSAACVAADLFPGPTC